MNYRKKITTIVTIVILGLLFVSFTMPKRNVEIVDNGKVVTVQTRQTDPEKIIQQAGVELAKNEGFVVSTKEVVNGSKIEILRAVPLQILTVPNAEKKEVFIGAATVEEVLKKSNIDYKGKAVYPNLKSRPREDTIIRIFPLLTTIEEVEVALPYESIEESDADMDNGDLKLITPGNPGLKKIVVAKYFDAEGQDIVWNVEEKVVSPVVNEVVRVGTKSTIPGLGAYTAVYEMHASAYLPSDGGGNGITASGLRAKQGIVAVDPRVIPLGTRVYIPGYGPAIAADTGGMIKGMKIDLCMESYSDAINFGRRSVTVYVLE